MRKFKNFILSLVSTASALNQTIEIPMIIRSLAGSIALEEEKNLPLPVDPSFLDTLDTGGYRLISAYELQWWPGRKPRDLDLVEILNAGTV